MVAADTHARSMESAGCSGFAPGAVFSSSVKTDRDGTPVLFLPKVLKRGCADSAGA